MRPRVLPLLAVLALACCTILPLAAPSQGAVVGEPDIYMPGQEPMFTTGSVPIMVAGVIHSIDVSLDSPSTNVTILFHAGTTPPATQNDTNYYTWACKNGVFSDVEYGMYANLSQCSVVASINTYKFSVGVTTRAVSGAWLLTILVDGVQEYVGDVQIEIPDAGFSLSRPDFYFTISPFQASSVSSYNPTNQSFYVRVYNNGNIPLYTKIRFAPYGEYFSLRFVWDNYNTSEQMKADSDYPIFQPKETRFYYIDFAAPEWSPREFEVKGTVRCEADFLLSPATVALQSAWEQEFSITVRVQRTGYELLNFGKVTVQYVKNVPLLEYGNSTTIDAYFTGEGSVTIELDGDRVSITSATVDDVAVDPDGISMTLTNSTEKHLRVTVKATEASNTAFTARVIYNMSWSDGAAPMDETFATTITVNRVPAGYEEPISINTWAIIAIVAVVIAMVAFMTYYANKKKKERAEQRKQKKKGRGKRG